jgi:DeoR/GlpR family transcriptional regulator of sugar metabolism
MSERFDFVREDVILRELSASGRVLVSELAERLGVSTVTVRKDLDSLESRSLLRRVRGGAVAPVAGDEGAFTDRLRQDSGVKREIARDVARLVQDGDVIGLDSSTSSFFLAQELVDRSDLLVVTHSLRIATLLMEHSSAQVVVPGGVLRRASASLVGAFSNVLEGRGRIGIGFFGIAALSPSLGMLELSSEEAATKRSLLTACDSVIVTFSSSKIGAFGLHPFAAASEVTALYTDERAGDEWAAEWTAAGPSVTRVAGTGALLDRTDVPAGADVEPRLRAVDR